MQDSLPILDSAGASEGPVKPEVARQKLEHLKTLLAPLVQEGALVAFSGGVDSAFLLWAARGLEVERGEGRVLALTTTSASTPSRDREDAGAFSSSVGAKHVWAESEEVAIPEYARNDRDRCYHCKVELFRIAGEVAERESLKWILYGYNASDRGDDRPGHRAAQEAGALSPLAEAGLRKTEIRFLLKEAGLSLAEKPSSPCLSSRIQTGVEVTPERLQDVEALEEILRQGGASTLRVRICRAEGESYFLRIEAAPEEMERILACREEVLRAGRDRGYRWVTLDLGGYRTGGGVS